LCSLARRRRDNWICKDRESSRDLTADEIRIVEGGNMKSADDEWTDAKNDRRFDLIERKVAGTITADEEREFQDLQQQMRDYRDRVAPLPLEETRQLHQKLVELARSRGDNITE
jgi:hypothetical protein